MGEHIIDFVIRGGFVVTPCPAGKVKGEYRVMVGSIGCLNCEHYRGGEKEIISRGFGSGWLKCDCYIERKQKAAEEEATISCSGKLIITATEKPEAAGTLLPDDGIPF